MNHVDLEIEASTLGALLCGRGAADHLLPRLCEGDFTDPHHRQIFAAMTRCGLAHDPIDTSTVSAALRAAGRTDSVEHLPRIVESTASPRNVSHYVERVRDLGAKRRLAAIDMRRIVDSAENSHDAVNAARAAIEEVARGRHTGKLISGHDLARIAVQRLDEAKARGPGPKGLTTGYPGLDRLLSGLRVGGLYVFAARPSQGKTALGMNVAMHAAQRTRVIVFSLEMPHDELADRALCAEGRISTDEVASGDLDDDGWAKAGRALGRISDLALFVDDRGGMQISELVATAKSAHAEKPVGLVVVDYLQLLRGSQRRRDSREQEVAEVARELKTLAKDLGAPVLALAQLNRDVEKRENKRPRMADLRESGEIEQAADVVALLYRESVYEPDADPKRAELIIEKNRHGAKRTIELAWSPEWVRFDSATDP